MSELGNMKTTFIVSFRNPEAIYMALCRLHDDNREPYKEINDRYFDIFTTKIDDIVDEYSKDETEIRIEFDILNNTARLLPVKEWK